MCAKEVVMEEVVMEKKYIVGILTGRKDRDTIKTTTVDTIEEADNFALEVAVTWGLEKGYVKDRETKVNVKFYTAEDFK